MPTPQELKAAKVWENVDRVSGDPAMTEYKRRLRHRQALWRERARLPVGGQKMRDGTTRPIGSRVELTHARETGANFVNANALEAARARLDTPQRHQMLDETRLWADLLSSMPMCFNLLGDLHADTDLATRVAHHWFPDLVGTVSEVCFEWSPGRSDPEYLGNRTAFDAALLLDLGSDRHGVVGIETKYHEHPVAEKEPASRKLERYVEVTERSGAFRSGWRDRLVGTKLQQIWLDHLLVLAMLQHPSGRWAAGRFVLVHPEENVGFARVAREYADVLADPSTSRFARLRTCSRADCRRPRSTRSAAGTSSRPVRHDASDLTDRTRMWRPFRSCGLTPHPSRQQGGCDQTAHGIRVSPDRPSTVIPCPSGRV